MYYSYIKNTLNNSKNVDHWISLFFNIDGVSMRLRVHYSS